MRISDWSSDVCSSDLALHENPSPRAVSLAFSASLGSDDIHVSRPLMASTAWRQLSGLRLQNSSTPWKSSSMVPTGDRKSVVEGKSVSVRVNLGGRRIVKKKIGKRESRSNITQV